MHNFVFSFFLLNCTCESSRIGLSRYIKDWFFQSLIKYFKKLKDAEIIAGSFTIFYIFFIARKKVSPYFNFSGNGGILKHLSVELYMLCPPSLSISLVIIFISQISRCSYGRLNHIYCSCIYFRNMLMVPEQPLADAIHYKNHDVIKLLEKHGAQHLVCLGLGCIYIW